MRVFYALLIVANIIVLATRGPNPFTVAGLVCAIAGLIITIKAPKIFHD